MSASDLLHGMLSELAGPMLLIGGDKHLLFASPALRRLVGMEVDALPCDALLYPAIGPDAQSHCCWNVLDTYLAGNEAGLWQLRDGQGACQPVLCEIRAFDMADRPVMIAIVVKPLKELVSPVALSFFRCLRRSAPTSEAYEEGVAEYFRKNYGFGVAKWLRFDRNAMPALETQPMEKLTHAIEDVDPLVRENGLFDIVVEMAGRERVFHVFQSPQGVERTCLVVGDTGGRFGDEVICAVRAAVAVWAEPADLPDPGNRAINPSLIELLSATEREILGCLQQGMCDKEIARLRHVSVNTARNQVHAVMHKVGVNRRTRLVAFKLADIQEH